MILVDYTYSGEKHLAFLVEGMLYQCALVHELLPNSSDVFLQDVRMYLPMTEHIYDLLIGRQMKTYKGEPLSVSAAEDVQVIVWPDQSVRHPG